MVRFFLALWALSGCGDAERAPQDSGADCAQWVFHDGDADTYGDEADALPGCDEVPTGYVARGGDCDDADAAVHPDAAEACNGADDDCDAEIDEAAGDAPSWYRDADGDSHGDPASATAACVAPTGFVADALDCDDTDAAVSPDAAERCDGDDDDCDGEVDEPGADGASAFFVDADGDGHGDPDAPVLECDWREGLALDGDDCDDTDGQRSPSADETCNGADDDCDGEVDEDSAVDAPTWYGDADGDGFGGTAFTAAACSKPSAYVDNADDCDDFDDTVHPDADERCGGDDEDCDGEVDEDSAVDATVWTVDADGDGHGDRAAVGAAACTAPAGTAEAADDCDDTDATVSPSAAERCGGADEDCDGATDEAGADGETTWYTDGDGDGRGDASTARLACDAAAGEVADGEDCDDGDAAVSPDAAEDCSTAADDDCSGAANDTCWPTGSLTSGDAWVSYRGTASGAGFGRQVDGGTDVTGDGIDDLVVISENLSTSEGWPYVLAGSLDASTTRSTIGTGTLTTASVSTLGDLDGDGVHDVAARDQDSGTVSVWLGRSSGWGVAPDTTQAFSTTYDDVRADDLDADGLAELITNQDRDTLAVVYDVLGAPSRVRITNTTADQYLGMHTLTADLDGDGLPSLIFGSYYGSKLWVFQDAPTADCTVADADFALVGEASLGGAMVALDADDDGTVDLVAGADQGTPVSLYLLPGPTTAWSGTSLSALATLTVTAPLYAGTSMVGDDLDGDGDDDLAVGQHADDDTWVFLGPLPTGTLDVNGGTDYDTRISLPTAVSDAGSLAPLGNAAAGYSGGLAIGVMGDDTAATDAGAVYLFVPEG